LATGKKTELAFSKTNLVDYSFFLSPFFLQAILSEIRSFLASRADPLAAVDGEFLAVESVPRNLIGKLDRPKLRENMREVMRQ